jgi:lipopolysaccharide transport system permease protein
MFDFTFFMNLVSAQSQQDSKDNAAKNQNKLLNSSNNQILLPENPVVVIEPSKAWVALNLRDLWQYRDLLYILTMRDIKVRYKQTLLGAAWAIIQPLFTMLIFTLFFGKLAGMPSDGIPYPIFAYAGLLPWTFFSNAVTNSGNSLVGNSNLITKIYFPRMIIPMASVASGLLDFVIAFGLLVVLMFYYGVGLSINLLMLPVLLVLTSFLAIGVGMWMSALNVKYRDIRYALPFLIQLGMFASPIIYPLSLVPEKWRWVMALNPLAGQIEAYRSAFFGKPFDWLSLGISAVLTFAVLIYSAYNFRRMEKSFADII